MAKDNNLTDFLSDLANAIREKKGTTEPINPQDFASEITSIETGGGMVADAPINDVNFYDYDGTRLYSYSWDEIESMTELPPLPSRKGLVCEGWNYTLEQIKEQPYKKADVGALYNTDDGKTRFYIYLKDDNGRVGIQPSNFNGGSGFIIDWGDGTTESTKGYGDRVYHQYLKEGNYVISIGNNEKITLAHSGLKAFSIEYGYLKKIECGTNIYIQYQGFRDDRYLESISLSTTSILDYECLQGCSSLKAYICNRNYLPSRIVYNATTLRVVSLSPTITSIQEGSFYACKTLWRVCIPMGVESIGKNAFYGSGISHLYIPPSVLSIGSYAFDSTGLRNMDFSLHTSVPTLGGNALPYYGNMDKIIVPDALYDEWIATSGWTGYASIIVKASEQ